MFQNYNVTMIFQAVKLKLLTFIPLKSDLA